MILHRNPKKMAQFVGKYSSTSIWVSPRTATILAHAMVKSGMKQLAATSVS